MSELIQSTEERKRRLKQLILKLHTGESEQQVRRELIETLGSIPYGEVVAVEQELIDEGLPETEVLKLCDAHSAVLRDNVDLSGMRPVPEGHPVEVMRRENAALREETAAARALLAEVPHTAPAALPDLLLRLREHYNRLLDVDKHYQRKEYLLFPYLEKKGLTGPPKVMWGKHDETRGLLKGSLEILQAGELTPEELAAAAEMVLGPALDAVEDMTNKEEQILLPMTLDKLTEQEWYEIDRQSADIGFCLYDPPKQWRPAAAAADEAPAPSGGDRIRLPSGSFSAEELTAILNTLPVDITFVDRNDRVRYFSQSRERIFQRNRAILNRDVRHCHPPASAHIVERIIEDFKSGRQSRAPFWINPGGRFIHIEYFALRDEKGEYLGILEVSQDLTRLRALEGEQRILSYADDRREE